MRRSSGKGRRTKREEVAANKGIEARAVVAGQVAEWVADVGAERVVVDHVEHARRP
jgi:hypothetical protein